MSAYNVSVLLADYVRKKRLPEEYTKAIEQIGYDTINQTLDKIQLLSRHDEVVAMQQYVELYGDKGLWIILERMKKQTAEITKQNAVISVKNKEIEGILTSKSFRIGRGVTMIPRIIRDRICRNYNR